MVQKSENWFKKSKFGGLWGRSGKFSKKYQI